MRTSLPPLFGDADLTLLLAQELSAGSSKETTPAPDPARDQAPDPGRNADAGWNPDAGWDEVDPTWR